MKKKLLAIALFSYLANAIFAQETTTAVIDTADKKTQTLFNSKRTKLNFIGLAVAPEYQFMSVGSGQGSAAGSSFLVILNRRWSVGSAAYMTEQNFDPKLNDNSGLRLRQFVSGGVFEFTPNPHKLIHLSFPIFLGRSRARLDSTFSNRHGYHGHEGDFFDRNDGNNIDFWVAQPNLRVEMNVARFAKIYAGAGYRFAMGPVSFDYANASGGTSNLGTADFSGYSVQVGAKIGFFEFQTSRLAKLKKPRLRR